MKLKQTEGLKQFTVELKLHGFQENGINTAWKRTTLRAGYKNEFRDSVNKTENHSLEKFISGMSNLKKKKKILNRLILFV